MSRVRGVQSTPLFWSGVCLALVGLAVVLLNPTLWWVPIVCILIVAAIRVPTMIVIYLALLCFAVPILLILGAIWFLNGLCIACGPRPVDYWSVTARVSAEFEEGESDQWVLNTQIEIPPEAAAAVANAAYFDENLELDPYGDPPELERAEQQRLITKALMEEGWTLAFRQDDNPVFERTDSIPAHVENFPLTTTLTIPIPQVDVSTSDIVLTPDADSVAELIGPVNLISSSRPLGDRGPSPRGEAYIIPLATLDVDDPVVTVQAISPWARIEPLTSLTKVTFASAFVWVFIAFWTLVGGIFSDRLKSLLERMLSKLRRPDTSHPPQDSDQAEREAGAP